jgi:hypothetical protein
LSRRPLLGVVSPETGEIVSCPSCQHREDVIVQLEKENRLHKAKITKLERDVEIDARKDPLWDEGEGVFQWWALACNHEGSRFEAEELYLIKPHLKRVGPVGCLQAICGAAYEPYETDQKNGRRKKHDGWDTIFATKAKMERFQERVPGEEGSELWKMWLVTKVESELR